MKQTLNTLTPDIYSSFLDHLSRFVSLNAVEKERILEVFAFRKVKKKENLLTEGQVCSYNYFVVKGCLRVYLITNTGLEQITQFGIENWWMTDFDSFENQTPSQFFIQAIEESEVIVIEKNSLESLYIEVPKIERYFRIILQKNFVAAQRRILWIHTISSEQRYRNFVELFPSFVQRIPQYMLASYLGITPEFLSKIRAKKNP
ncbi:Crp/Fnr family transcriptional regulator [Solitalea sp. MAHUQ-68]|uniref:Crp/Fnr family transcriptional regulator n=1 Tax=Solitalea agri TaxID=2953739 RepID=A0A9X2F5U1_9SPHI|nr:Crp/Fnr family transcriptional regulator [Solitalea agri]MCO4294680.1 Crp/Fnr family transcriptional regulator [Solitalea agri]